MLERIGIYVCECGPNIRDAIDIEELVRFASDLENVVVARAFRLLCSDDGRELITKDIRKRQLNRVVIAACSPKEHEITFRKALQEAGLNPYLLQIANIREQCAWVINDRILATDKAKAMIKAAAKRVIYHSPIKRKEIECVPDVLVVGAGIAGISAALTLSQKSRKVYLVEKSPCIGGKVARYEEIFPSLECASCILGPKLDEVLYNENIELFTCSEVQEVLGSYGNFTVKVNQKAKYVHSKACLGCGACFEVCPVTVKNEFNEDLDERKAIYIPYAGALPNVAVIDRENCIRFSTKGGSADRYGNKATECDACRKACPFQAIDYKETDQIRELKVGAIVVATGFDVFDPRMAPQYGYGKSDNVCTALEFERILSSTGPTGGQILLKNGEVPKSVALIHCVGSKTKGYNEYCSGICCMCSLKLAHLIKKKLPDAKVLEFYSDLCLPGKGYQKFFNGLCEEGIDFVRTKTSGSTEVIEEGGQLLVQYEDISEIKKKTSFDMVVLVSAIEPARGSDHVAKTFDIAQGDDGFFLEQDEKLAPVSTSTEGIFIAGCAQGPKDIQGSVAQGQAAAGEILSRLIPGEKLELEVMTVEINVDLCSGCRTCIGLCPFKAIGLNGNQKRAEVNELLCRGCGTCAAACPSGAIESKHFTDRQIFEEIRGILG
jgi:heterodisulfide reductase subunit A